MTKVIRYITGTQGIPPESRDFESIKEIYGLKKEHVDVWQYSGPLRREDFDVLREVFCSNQLPRLQKGKDKFLKKLKEIPDIPARVIGELERVIQEIGIPTCANDAVEFVQRRAKNRGLFVPVSYSYPTNRIEDLTSDTEALVFVDEKLEGNVRLRKTSAYHDPWAGYTEEGKIVINVLKQEKEADWNSWYSNSLRWIVDPIIRNQILGEEIMVFTRL